MMNKLFKQGHKSPYFQTSESQKTECCFSGLLGHENHLGPGRPSKNPTSNLRPTPKGACLEDPTTKTSIESTELPTKDSCHQKRETRICRRTPASHSKTFVCNVAPCSNHRKLAVENTEKEGWVLVCPKRTIGFGWLGPKNTKGRSN